MRRFSSFSLVLCLIITQPLFPQQRRKAAPPKPAPAKAPAPETWPVVSLHVSGNKLYSEEAILAIAAMKLGEPVSKQQFEAARERLTKTGAFETVGFRYGPTTDGKGYDGVFEVAEVEQLFPIRFEDLPATDKELRSYLAGRETLFADKIPGTKEVVGRFTSEIQEYLATRNYKEKIIGAVVAEKPGELVVRFRPVIQPPAVAEVKFTGNQAIPASQLQNTLAAVAVGVPYREATLRQLLDGNVRPLYEARGRMRAVFTKLGTEKANGIDGVRVTIAVEEGPEFKFGDIKASAGVVNNTELLRLAGVTKGDPANFELVNTGIDRIQQRLRVGGYMHAKTRAERTIHDQEKTVDVAFISEPGVQFKMGKLLIQGLDVETEPVVRKLWSMKAGSPYNADYPANFLARIKEEGYFENLRSTTFDQKVDEASGTVDVTLVFKGGPDPEEQKRKKERERPF